VKIRLTVKGGRRLYAALLPLTGTATVLYADGGAPGNLTHQSVALFALGLFCGRLFHDSNRRVGR